MAAVMCYNSIRKIPAVFRFEVVDMAHPRVNIDIDHLVNLYNAGESIRSMAKVFECGTHAVTNRLVELGLDTDRRGADLDMDEAVRLYRAGTPKRTLAKQFGVSEMCMINRLRKAGIATENRSDACRTRNARMTAEERSANTKAAHDAVRGTKKTHADLCKRAATKARIAKPGSAAEEALGGRLAAMGLPVSFQRAADKYNIDIAVGDSVAVEVSGRAKKGVNAERIPERVKYLLDAGWALVLVWARKSQCPISDAAAEYVASLYELVGRDPTARGHYWVIWGDGKLMAERRPYSDELPGILTPIAGLRGRAAD